MDARRPPAVIALDAQAGKAKARPVVGLRTWIALAVLTCVYILNFLDRSLLAILAKPIQDTLHISDGQLGLIGGFYFALFYCFIAIPVGWLADRTNRVKVLTLACAIWSAATMFCGFAANYPQLVMARMAVGFGEAGGVPPSYALITDTFPPGRRGMAFGIYNLGPAIGAALGIAFGASIAAIFNWRDAFIALGFVGLLVAIAIPIIMREPPRGAMDDNPEQVTQSRSGFWQTMTAFFSRPTLILVALGSGAAQFIIYGLANFTVLFLMREKGMTLEQVAIYYALVVGIVLSAAMLVSGRIIDHFTRRSRQAFALVPAISLVMAIPFYIGFVWAPSWHLSLLLLIGPMFLNFFYLPSAIVLVQEEVRPDQRVMAGALLLLIMNFIGLGLGPTYVGAASDFFRASHPEHSLQIALYTLTPFYGLAILLFLWLARVLRHESHKTQGTNP
jgi:predicted MFS family arabinose efflux permease